MNDFNYIFHFLVNMYSDAIYKISISPHICALYSTKPVLDIKVAFDMQSHESKSKLLFTNNTKILQFKLLYITLEFLLFNNLMFYLHIIIGAVKSLLIKIHVMHLQLVYEALYHSYHIVHMYTCIWIKLITITIRK